MSERIARQRCIKVPSLSAVVSVSDYVRLPVPIGPIYGFDWHDYMGPHFCGRSGGDLKRQPGERHPVWGILERWLKHGKRVDAHGFAVLTPVEGEG